MIKQKKNKKFRPFYVKKRLSNGEIFTGFLLKATKTFTLANGDIVRKGERGGLVKSYKSLSQNGNWWIDADSIVYNAKISDDALVINSVVEKGIICNNAIVEHGVIKNGLIRGNAQCVRSYVSGKDTCIKGIVVDSIVDSSVVEGNSQVVNSTIEKGARIGRKHCNKQTWCKSLRSRHNFKFCYFRNICLWQFYHYQL